MLAVAQGCSARVALGASRLQDKRKTNNSFNQRDPQLQPWPRAMESKIVQTTPEWEKKLAGLNFFLFIYSLVDPTAVQRGGRHCCPGGIGRKKSQ